MKKLKKLICTIVLICFSGVLFAQSGMSDVVIDETILEPKDPILGTVVAIGPGLLAHGWGQFYAENYKMGLALFGLELVSIITIGVGYVEFSNPNNLTDYAAANNVKRAGAITLAAGVLLFVATWVADIALAGNAAMQYNKEHNLEFKMQQESLLNGNYNNTYAAIYNLRF